MTTTIEETKVTRWPFPYDTLEKGTEIPPESIEPLIEPEVIDGKLTRIDRWHWKYGLKLLAIAEEIEHQMADRGLFVTVKQTKRGLRILTDDESSIYNECEQRRHLRAVARRQRRLIGVDAAQLTDEQKQQHERRVLVGGLRMQHLANARKEIRLLPKPHQRELPGLPE